MHIVLRGKRKPVRRGSSVSRVNEGDDTFLVPRRAGRSLTLKLVGEDDDKERQEYLA